MKNCKKCNGIFEESYFYKQKTTKDGLETICKKCKLITTNKARKIRIKNGSVKESIKNKEYHKKNADKIKQRKRLNYINNKKRISAKNKNWRLNNKEHLLDYQRKYTKEKLKKDNLYRLTERIRRAIRESFNKKGLKKKTNTQLILGCSFNEFKEHIESQFKEWMNWDNYGLYNGELNYGWDIDHIIPISSAKTEEDIIRLNHYSNLQPLCSKVNRDIKRNQVLFGQITF